MPPRACPADTRATYLKAINASLDACVPLKFTGGLGGALAGRPIAIRYVDNRELGKQSGDAVRTSVIAGLTRQSDRIRKKFDAIRGSSPRMTTVRAVPE